MIRRQHAQRIEQTVSIQDPGVAVPAGVSPERDLEYSELAAQVARAIESIPASRRPVVRMYLAGHPREEIASLLGWTEAKTRNLLYRGLTDLRARLTAQGIGWETTT